jgi:hypothetical protein
MLLFTFKINPLVGTPCDLVRPAAEVEGCVEPLARRVNANPTEVDPRWQIWELWLSRMVWATEQYLDRLRNAGLATT